VLYLLARDCGRRGVIVEIGSFQGLSTILLALGSRTGSGGRVYAVDPHLRGTRDRFRGNIARAGFEDLVQPVFARSTDAAHGFSEPIELLFVDGSHKREDVEADLACWLPKLVDGGTLVLHDTVSERGPKAVAADVLFRSHQFTNVRFVRPEMSIGTKVARNSRAARVRQRVMLLLKRGHELRRASVPRAARPAARSS
jgi:predicted O-methyltransferase YrrM